MFFVNPDFERKSLKTFKYDITGHKFISKSFEIIALCKDII